MVFGCDLFDMTLEGEIVLPAFGLNNSVKRVSAFSSYSQRPQISHTQAGKSGTEINSSPR